MPETIVCLTHTLKNTKYEYVFTDSNGEKINPQIENAATGLVLAGLFRETFGNIPLTLVDSCVVGSANPLSVEPLFLRSQGITVKLSLMD